MTTQTTLNDCYPNGITGNGIFTDLQKLSVPWKDSNISTSLDISYFGNHSGQKAISPFIENFTADDSVVISDTNREIIAKCLFDVYGNQWKHLWETTQQEYNMLWNTDATIETDTSNTGSDNRTSSGSNTGTDTHTLSGTDTDTRTGTDTTASTGTDTVTSHLVGIDTDNSTDETIDTIEDNIYHHNKSVQYNTPHDGHKNTTTTQNKMAGFDSTENGQNTTYSQVTEDKAIVTKTYNEASDTGFDDIEKSWTNSDLEDKKDTIKTTHVDSLGKDETTTNTTEYGKTDTETLNIQDKTDYGKTDTETVNLANSTTETGGNTFTGKETVRRTGNIGVTTNQQMIEAERQLWKWNFFNQIFSDVDNYLTLSVY